ncbi:gamma-glutamyltransferase family protein [Phreatobacter stygius]|uniref:Gamma-glutamyltranspeptidase n=1 Tax=Phreatobacter stygius TaxID=1940610 RepID=A0A4D7B4X7_9HYPH|nr:gamma-glutamyltransferase [Phreatobacter stygius]QCI68011.1 gamma-glutamyltranspeptidase [Phreatobacter stygius]
MHGLRPTITSLHGMVAAAHPHAAQAGARMLADGGNAFDAAAATAAALNVVEPFMSSLAGEGLATMWVAAEKRVRVLDFVPKIPSAFPVDRFRERAELERGALPVGTPGNLAGWCELVRTYGRKPLSEIFAPAIALAEDGFGLAEFGVAEIVEQAPLLKAYPALYDNWAKAYLPAGDVAVGAVLRQPDLGATLRALATKGPGHLYGGELGARIVAHLASLGGAMTLADLADFKPVWREPLPARYRDLTVHVPPPPCEGFQFLLTLRILEGLDFKASAHNGVDHLDQVYRAIRLAAGLRIAHNNPPADKLAELLSDASIERLRARVRDGAPISGPTEQWMAQAAEDPAHTTSFSIADREGNMICITQSLGSPFGSGVVVPGTGLCLNNFLYWADVQPDSPNRSRPGGDLLMCMSPSISTRDGKPVLALGTPGSYGILQTQAQAFVHHVDFGLPLQEAIEAPRARLWDGRFVQTENRVAPEVVAGLAARGHEIEAFDEGWTMKVGGMQAVAVDPATGLFTGAADPRRDGYVATP